MTAAFVSTLATFDQTPDSTKLGKLIAVDATRGFATHFTSQTEAWQAELLILSRIARCCVERFEEARNWTVLLEFEIPRRGKRPDAILIADDLIFVIEFKVGSSTFVSADTWQVFSYALDLRDFHAQSRGRTIIPLLVATGASARGPIPAPADRDSGPVIPVQFSGDGIGVDTAATICEVFQSLHNADSEPIDPDAWDRAPYHPTPTIIEAAQRIFAGHGVTEISHAFAHNLDLTCGALIRAIADAERNKRRLICFVTGIPGAGKTLAGLNVVHDPFFRSADKRAAVFLSGNGPLVKIVRAALVQDRQRAGQPAADATRTVRTFIDNVHRFITVYGVENPSSMPYENVIVFDEAQRAWDAEAVARKRSIAKSEPELVLDAMRRADGWCAIIALVGSGQEIYKGEAGLAEWGRALNASTVEWNVCVSPAALNGSDGLTGQKLFEENIDRHVRVSEEPALHLDVSVRSPRARRIAEWVNAILVGAKPDEASADVGREYPVTITRSINTAREWLRLVSDGTQSAGLVASSGALRLRADGIEVSSGFRGGYAFEKWFLADRHDVRSSSQLEVPATEFECQGLELDWTCVCWGHDFLYSSDSGDWIPRKFVGAKWRAIKKQDELRYTVNKYRVLLTRARRGMIIWIPRGDSTDPTRDPALLDETALFLTRCGLSSIDDEDALSKN